MEKKTRKIELNNIILPLFWAFILVLCVFILSSTAKASSPLPYQVNNDEFDFHGMSAQDVEDYINQQIQVNWSFDFETYPTLMYSFEANNNDYLIIFTGYPSNSPSTYFFDLRSVPYSTFDTDINYCTFTYTNICKIQLRYPYTVNYVYDWNWWPYETQNLTLFGTYYYPEYISENFTLAQGTYDENTNPYVLQIYEEPVTIPTGHATQPINNPNNIINDTNGHRIPKPTKPTMTQYNWTTYITPQLDTTNIESLLESIFNANQYLFSYLFINLGGLFSNLINNVGDLFDYVVDSIYYAVNNIVSAIQDLATDFYNNMVSLFEPIAEVLNFLYESFNDWKEDFTNFADLFIHPFDEEEYEEQIQDCEFLMMYDTLMANCEDIQEIFDNAEERDYFSLYISFENPLADAQHRIISSEINFDWLVPLRSVYRPFLWVFTMFELFVGSMRLLGNIIGGKAK